MESNEITGFVFQKSFFDALKEMPDAKDVRDSIISLCEYVYEGKEPSSELGFVPKMFLTLARPTIDKSVSRYRASVENGKKGGAPKGSRNNPNGRRGKEELTQTNQEQTQNKPTSNLYKDKDKDRDKDRDKEISTNVDNKKTARRFSIPTLQEVKDYIASNSYSVDAARFIDYYTANGWKVGNSQMKDWQATVRNWDRRTKETGNNSPQPKEAAPQGVKLGIGEYIDENGRRTYGSGRATIPTDAAPRPSERHQWDAGVNRWILL